MNPENTRRSSTIATDDRFRPTKADLEAARSKTVPDVIRRGLSILFAGINPGLYTAAIGHHFGRPGNRFWPALHRAGLTPRVFSPWEERKLLSLGFGITNVVSRASARADEVSEQEFVDGGRVLVGKIKRYRPRCVAILGLGAYRTAFQKPFAALGPQPETLGGVRLWVLPNPSGLNANYQLSDLARLFRQLRRNAGPETSANGRRAPTNRRGAAPRGKRPSHLMSRR